MPNAPLRIDILTLFPGMFTGPLTESLLGKAVERGRVVLKIHNVRDYSDDERHRKVDDRPYGGGAGMVMQAEPLYQALQAVKRSRRGRKPYVILMAPQGQPLTQTLSKRLVGKPWLVLICGHYEGVDERFMRYVDEEVSIGDYVLTGGELPAMVLTDAVVRLVPGVVKEEASLRNDSFEDGLLDYPHYTRPARWRGQAVPDVLLSGRHQDIDQWRRQQALAATRRKRPDLLREKSI